MQYIENRKNSAEVAQGHAAHSKCFRAFKSATKIAVLLVAMLHGPDTIADVWKRNADGELTLHRTLDHFQRARLNADWRPPSIKTLNARRQQYASLIERISKIHAVDARLVKAIIEVESAYAADAVSKTGAQGLMQLMPATAKRYFVRDPLEPSENIRGGVQYLSELREEFRELELILAAYNAGEKAVRRYDNQVPPFKETRGYIERVLAVLDRERLDASK